MSVEELEIVLQDIQFDYCANILDPQALDSIEKVQDLIHWAVLSNPPLLMHAKGGALGQVESSIPINLQNENDT